jgi:hypothetical protein
VVIGIAAVASHRAVTKAAEAEMDEERLRRDAGWFRLLMRVLARNADEQACQRTIQEAEAVFQNAIRRHKQDSAAVGDRPSAKILLFSDAVRRRRERHSIV